MATPPVATRRFTSRFAATAMVLPDCKSCTSNRVERFPPELEIEPRLVNVAPLAFANRLIDPLPVTWIDPVLVTSPELV